MSTKNYGDTYYKMTGSPVAWTQSPVCSQAAQFSNNTANRIYCNTTDLNYVANDFTVALWLTKNYSAKTESGMYAFTVGRADAGGWGYGLEVSSTTGIVFRFGNKGYTIPGVQDNTWNHLVFGRRGNAMFGYLNGLDIFTDSALPGTLPSYSDGAGLGIGCFHYASGDIYPLIGAVSDFRIYDHALSKGEVYELSRGLIAHYPMNNPHVIGISNMYSGEYANGQLNGNFTRTKLTGEVGYKYTYTYTGTGSDSWPSIYLPAAGNYNFTVGKTYCWSCMCRVNKWTDGGFYFRSAVRTNDYSHNQVTVASPSLADGKWHEYSTTLTLTQEMYDNANFGPRIEFYTSSLKASGVLFDFDIDIKCLQLIEADTYPGWINNDFTSSTMSNTGGYGQYPLLREGYGLPAAAPRYGVGTDFKQQCFFKNEAVNLILTQYTISFWLKPMASSKQHFIFGTFDSWPNNGVGMYRSANTPNYSILMKVTGESSYKQITYPGGSLNTWGFVTITWDGTTYKVYKNGSVYESQTYGSSGTCSMACIILGNSKYCNSGQSYPDWTETEEAVMSDFRLYGRAFSATEVERLYRLCASVTRLGDCFVYGVSERKRENTTPGGAFGRDGILSCAEVTENGGRVCVYNSSGGSIPDPNTASWSYTPANNTDNSCMTGPYFSAIPGILRYHVDLTLEWSGFANISSDRTNFSANFQGSSQSQDGSTWTWTSNFVTSALNNATSITSLCKGAASGIKIYSVDLELTSAWMTSYKGCSVGIRTNYSNGTGTLTIKKLRIYPAAEYRSGMVSLGRNGQVLTRKINET